MIRIREAIVVEGRYDKNVLSQLIDAPIFETSGFGVMNNRELLQFLREVAQKRGLIIFTDSDGAGFVIVGFQRTTITFMRKRTSSATFFCTVIQCAKHPGQLLSGLQVKGR